MQRRQLDTTASKLPRTNRQLIPGVSLAGHLDSRGTWPDCPSGHRPVSETNRRASDALPAQGGQRDTGRDAGLKNRHSLGVHSKS